MPETLPPCPVCGGDKSYEFDDYAPATCCRVCGASLPPDAWRRLADAARLAAAVDAERALLDATETQQGRYISRLAAAVDPSIASRLQLGRGLYDDQILRLMTAPAEVRAAALVALAGEVGRGE